MNRRSGKANTGYIRWPTHLRNSGEGGMWVYAVVPVDNRREPFVECCVEYPTLPAPNVFLDPLPPSFQAEMKAVRSRRPQPRGLMSKSFWPIERHDSRDLLATVLLGTSGGSWSNLHPCSNPKCKHQKGLPYWICSESDLTPEGKRLVALLSKLYGGRKVHLLTFLDT